MAKKATTIILLIVVVLLLASTVYVSIILTSDSDSPTTARQTRASEIDDTLTQTQDETSPPSTDPLDPAAPATQNPSAEPNTLTEITPDPSGATPSDLLAYANPTPTGTEASPREPASGGTELDPEPTPETSETPSPNEDTVTGATPTPIDDLPETGMGQPTKTATAAPTLKVTTPPQLGTSLPVAGSLGTTVVTVVVAGVTILASFFL